MGTNGSSRKKLKTSAIEGLTMPLSLKKKKKSKEEYSDEKNSNIVQSEENSRKHKEVKKKNKSLEKKRSSRKTRNSEDDDGQPNQSNIEADEAIGEKKKSKLKNKKRKMDKIIDFEIGEADVTFNEMEGTHQDKEIEGRFDEQTGLEAREKKKNSKKKKIKNEKMKKGGVNEVDEVDNEVENGSSQQKGKSKKPRKMNRKNQMLSKNDEEKAEVQQDEVYEISSGDEDCTAGMKKWIMEYYQSRPGLEILQQRIDDFITAHEEQDEQARKEREALIAEDGWTVVVHHKGRKKTTDSETGVTVGSVAPAAVMDKLSKKKTKDVGIDFYRFQKREAQRNEIMMLQSKFELDKKRIQQLRAARKFRPY